MVLPADAEGACTALDGERCCQWALTASWGPVWLSRFQGGAHSSRARAWHPMLVGVSPAHTAWGWPQKLCVILRSAEPPS